MTVKIKLTAAQKKALAAYEFRLREEDRYLGSVSEAESRFLSACDRWIAARQPLVANAAAHKKRDAEEHEARFQLANAAIHLAWFMRNPS